MRDLLQSRQEALAATLGGQYPQLRTTVWQSESSVQAAVQTLTPQMTENKKKVCCHAWSCAPPRRLLLQSLQLLNACLQAQAAVQAGGADKLLCCRLRIFSGSPWYSRLPCSTLRCRACLRDCCPSALSSTLRASHSAVDELIRLLRRVCFQLVAQGSQAWTLFCSGLTASDVKQL